MAPHLRSTADNAAMWTGLQHGDLDFVVTDHCRLTLGQKGGRGRTPEFGRLPDGVNESAPGELWCDGLPEFSQMPAGAFHRCCDYTPHRGVPGERLAANGDWQGAVIVRDGECLGEVAGPVPQTAAGVKTLSTLTPRPWLSARPTYQTLTPPLIGRMAKAARGAEKKKRPS